MRFSVLPAAILVLATASQPAFARGNEGHEIIAAIARDALTPQARAWVDAILATDSDTLTAPDMLSRATWADRWRDSGHRETADWHFVDLELAKPNLRSACFDEPKPSDPPSAGPAEDCVVDKINEFEAELSNPATPQSERLLALKYLLHFIGDVHQPLHAPDNQDRGGNCVHVSLGEQRTTNLHSFWDTAVLAPLGSNPQTVATALEKDISPADRQRWAGGSAAAWAQENYGVAKAVAYSIRVSGWLPERRGTDPAFRLLPDQGARRCQNSARACWRAAGMGPEQRRRQGRNRRRRVMTRAAGWPTSRRRSGAPAQPEDQARRREVLTCSKRMSARNAWNGTCQMPL